MPARPRNVQGSLRQPGTGTELLVEEQLEHEDEQLARAAARRPSPKAARPGGLRPAGSDGSQTFPSSVISKARAMSAPALVSPAAVSTMEDDHER